METSLRIFPATAIDEACSQPVRGVSWVLEWAVAIAAMSFAIAILLEFGFRLTAERTLVQAASAGLREATLPHATDRSVAAAIRRQLGDRSRLANDVQIGVARDGAPVRGAIHAKYDDRFTVNLTVPSESVLPEWLQGVSPWKSNGEQTVWVDGR